MELETEAVLVEANKRWHKVKYTTGTDPDTFYQQYLPIRRYTARDSLLSVQRDYPNDIFWELADFCALELELIRRIDIDLKPAGTTYDQVLRSPLQLAAYAGS